ncbi:lactonase family protein [Silvibacterium dinghuense]|uniref:Lactonase n=1 Tax=Silvibacterium dinghuense TaxID=1560006 RepID=A0A4Q1SHZ9_9BACT|nr:beta-propeller fold lactonase family protein [Silvibacterium dinghuense]RXS97228.1 lactonase [Silvibacterium dinghuense]GGG97265.1 hypothetical protein GCM10011586_10680 [Silvibacterium dinghuense]
MRSVIGSVMAAVLGAGMMTPTIHAQDTYSGARSAVFVMTNNAENNEVLAYQREGDGQYVLARRVRTGGRGSGGTVDPLQSQGSLTLSGDRNLLFAVNSGSGTVSSFVVAGGVPVLVDREPTGGAFPVSVAEHNGTVYVLNAGGSGAIVAFHADAAGRLHEIPHATVYLTAANDGASDIAVSPNGKTLVVIEKTPNHIDTYLIQSDGTLGTAVVHTSVTPGVFSVSFTPSGTLIVSENQPDGTDVSSISSYAVNAGGALTAITQSIPTDGDGNCWNAITPDGKFVYVDNAATSTVAGYAIGASGALTPISGTIVAAEPDGAANLDMSISRDGKYLYTLDAGVGEVAVYEIQSNGTLIEAGTIAGLPEQAGWNGIAAY